MVTVLERGVSIGAAPQPRPQSARVRLDLPTRLALVLVVVILALLLVLPIGNVLARASSAQGLDVIGQMFTQPSNRRILVNTLVLGLVVGAIGTVLAFCFAYAQVRLRFRGKRVLHLLALLPIVSPPFAVASAIITLFGRNGMISNGIFGIRGDVYGLPGLTVVLVLSFFPVAYMNLKGMLESMDPTLDEAAADLGASRVRTFFTVTLPMLVPGFAGTFLLLFVEAIADLANPLVLGGDYTVLASRAYLALSGEYNVPAAAAYSAVLLVPALLVFVVQRYWVARKSVVTVTGKPSGTRRYVNDAVLRVPMLVVTVTAGAMITLVYVTVVVGSFVQILGVNNTITLQNYARILRGTGLGAFRDTTLLALIATPVAAVLGMLVGWLVVRKLRRAAGVVDFVAMLGLAVPGTVLGIGYALAYSTPTRLGQTVILPAVAGGSAMFGGAIAILMVYVASGLPLGQRAAVSSLQQIDPSIEEAATSLGAGGATTFRTVTLPLIRPALMTGLVSGFAKCMTLLSAIVFITTPSTRILTSEILDEVEAGRFGNAFAFCTLLIVVVLVVIGLITLALRPAVSRTAR